MNKSELIKAMSEELNIPVIMATDIVNTILDAMIETLVKGDGIEIRGFGSFAVKHYDPYIARNPKTQEPTKVLSKKHPIFKVGKDLKKAVNAGRK